MAEDLSIVSTITFDKTESDKNLKALLKELQQNNKINFNINANATQLANLKKQLAELQKPIKTTVEINKFKDDDIYKDLEKRKRQIEQLANTKANVTFTKDEDTKRINSAVITWTDNVGRLQKEYYKLNTTIKETNNTVTKTTSFDKVKTTFTDNIEASRKALTNFEKQLESLKTKNVKMEYEDNKNFDNTYTKTLNEINSLRQRGTSITETEKNKIAEKLKVLTQENELIAKNIELRKKADTDASVQQDIQNKIKQYQEKTNLNIREFKRNYSDLIPKDKMNSFEESLNGLSNKKFTSIKDLNNELKNTSIQLSKIKQEAKENGLNVVNKDSQSLFTTLSKNLQKFTEWMVVGTLFIQTKNAIADTIDYTVKMDTALTDLSKVVNVTKSEMEDMRNSSIQLGKDLGKSSVEIVKGMAEFGRVTKDLNEIKELTKTATLASNVSDLNPQEAAKALSTTMVSFKMNANEAMKILDQYNEIQNNMKISAKDLAEGISVVGSAAKQSGMSIESLEGAMTAIVSATGVSGGESATALKSMLSRTFRIGEEGSEDQGKSEKLLNSLGVSIREVGGQFKSFDSILMDVAKSWDTYDKNTKQNLAQTIGGTHHYSKFLALMENIGTMTKTTELALNSQGSAMNENAKYLNSVEGQWNIFKTTMEGVKSNLLTSDTLKDTLSGLNSFARGLENISSNGKGIPLLLASITTAFALFKKDSRMIDLNNIMGSGIVKGFDSIKIKVLELKARYVELDMQQRMTFGNTPTMLGKIGMAFTALTGKTIAQTLATGALEVATIALNAALSFGLSLAIQGVISGVSHWINKSKEAKEANEQLIQSTQDNISQNNSNIQTLSKMSMEYEKLKNKTELTVDEKEKFKQMQNDIAKISPEVVAGFTSEGDAMISYNTNLQDVIESLKEKNRVENAKLVEKGSDAYSVFEKDNKDTQKLIEDNKLILKNGAEEKAKLLEEYKNPNTAEGRKEEIGLNLTSLEGDLAKSKATLQKATSENETAFNKYKQSLVAIFKSDEGFDNLDKNIQNLILSTSNLKNISQSGDYASAISKAKEQLKQLNGVDVTSKMEEINTKFKDGKISTEEYNGAIRELLEKLAGLMNVKVGDLEESFKKVFNVNGAEKAQQTFKSLSDVKLELAKSAKAVQKEIEQVNKVLNEHGKSGEWDLEVIEKLAANGYPALLEKMGDDKALEQELIKIKEEKVRVTQDTLNKQLKMEVEYVNQVAGTHGIELSSFANAQEAKLSILKQSTNKMIEIYNAQIEAALKAESAATSAIERENAQRGAMMAGSKLGVQLGKQIDIDTHIDRYFNLKNFGSNVGKYIGEAGSKDYDGRKDSEKKEKQDVENIQVKIDRYLNLNSAIEKVNNALEDNKQKQESAHGIDKLKLLDEEISLLKQKQNAIARLTEEQKKEQAELENYLRGSWFEVGNGIIYNYEKRMKEIQDWANSAQGEEKKNRIETVKKLEEATKRYADVTIRDIGNSTKQWNELNGAIRKINEEKVNVVGEVEKKITEIYKKEHELRKAEIEKERDERLKAIDEIKNKYNKQNEEEDYQDSLNKEKQKLAELQDLRDNAMRDTSDVGKLRLQELMNQIKEQQEAMDKLALEHDRKIQNEALDTEKDKITSEADQKIKLLDEKFSPENMAQMVARAMATGLMEINGQLTDINKAFMDYDNKFGEGLMTQGKLIQSQMIDKFTEARNILSDMKTIMKDLGFKDIANIGKNVFGDNEIAKSILSPLSGIVYAHSNPATISNKTNNSSFQPEISLNFEIQGNPDETAMGKLKNMAQDVANKMVDALEEKLYQNDRKYNLV